MEQVPHRRASVGMAAYRSEHEVLGQVMASANLISSNQIWIVRLHHGGCHNMRFQNFRACSRRIAFNDIKRPLRKRFGRRFPVCCRDLVCGIAPDVPRRHPDLQPQHVLSLGRTACIDRGWLTADELGQAFGRQTVIHAALASGGLAKRVVEEAQRLRGLRETDDGGRGRTEG